MSELYTRLFVQTEDSHQELLSLVVRASGGTLEALWTVVSESYAMDVRLNDYSTEKNRRDHPEDFIYFPYTIEVITEGNPDAPSDYLHFVGALMEKLHAHGMKVVAACDWESELPGRGRLGV